jgi:iron complex outermembrane recepter protein
MQQGNQGLRLKRKATVAALQLACLVMADASIMQAYAADSGSIQSKQHYNIPAGPLDKALAAFASTSGINLSLNPDLTEGLQAKGLQGIYSVNEGFHQLLNGSGLEAVADRSGNWKLRKGTLSKDDSQAILPEVKVLAQAEKIKGDLMPAYAGGQVASGSKVGLLGNKSIMDTPFNSTSYTSQLMTDQQAITVADVLANDPSVRTISYGLTNAAGAGDSFMIRGFSVQNSVLLDGIYGIAPSRTLPVETAERIEVLKGPSALLNGMAPYDAAGGAINMVPKRAADTPLTRFTATYMSKGVFGGHLDVGRRFGEDNEWGVRFNGVYRNGKTATDGQSIELGAATVGIDYRGNRLRASLDAGHQSMNNEAPQGAGGLGISDAISVPRPPSSTKQIAQNWEYSKTKSDYALAKLEFDIRPDWTLYGAVGESTNRFQYLSTDVYVTDAQGNADATVYYWPDFWNYKTIQGGLRGLFHTGDIKHQINLNASYLKQTHGYTTDYYGIASFSTNIYDAPSVSGPSLAGFSSRPPKTDSLQLPSVALSDTISFLDDHVAVTLGVRRQNVKVITYDTTTGDGTTTYDKSAVTPMLALVVKPLEKLSLYGNYIEGLSKGDTASVGTTNAGQVFAPFKTKQYEVGAKYDFGRFSTTLSVFQIERPSGFAVSNGDGTSTYKVDGEQRNRGVELNVFGEVIPDVRLLGGVVYIDARQTRTDGGVNDGNYAPNVSKWQMNLGTEYDVRTVSGLTLTARMISSSDQYIDTINVQNIPGWTRWDIGSRYKTKAWDRPVTLRAGVENLFAHDYWVSGSGNWLYLGKPRLFTLSATMDF